jgi:hypothetical protein
LFWLLHLETSEPIAGSPKASKPRKKLQTYKGFKYTGSKANRNFAFLEIMPGGDDEPLIGTLHHFDLSLHYLDGFLPYEAIQYAWGSPRTNYSIRCNGESLDITSLKNALYQVRQPQHVIHT